MTSPDRRSRLDADWRAVIAGALAGPTLVVIGLLAGWWEGGLLPGQCQGLACVYLSVLLLYGGALLALWLLIATLTGLARRRWPSSRPRVVILRVLALLSYGPAVWVILTLADAG